MTNNLCRQQQAKFDSAMEKLSAGQFPAALLLVKEALHGVNPDADDKARTFFQQAIAYKKLLLLLQQDKVEAAKKTEDKVWIHDVSFCVCCHSPLCRTRSCLVEDCVLSLPVPSTCPSCTKCDAENLRSSDSYKPRHTPMLLP